MTASCEAISITQTLTVSQVSTHTRRGPRLRLITGRYAPRRRRFLSAGSALGSGVRTCEVNTAEIKRVKACKVRIYTHGEQLCVIFHSFQMHRPAKLYRQPYKPLVTRTHTHTHTHSCIVCPAQELPSNQPPPARPPHGETDIMEPPQTPCVPPPPPVPLRASAASPPVAPPPPLAPGLPQLPAQPALRRPLSHARPQASCS